MYFDRKALTVSWTISLRSQWLRQVAATSVNLACHEFLVSSVFLNLPQNNSVRVMCENVVQ